MHIPTTPVQKPKAVQKCTPVQKPTPGTKLRQEISIASEKLEKEISELDQKLRELGLSDYGTVIKSCASEVGTLPFITVDDLMSPQKDGVKPLNKAQASLVVEKCTPKKKSVHVATAMESTPLRSLQISSEEKYPINVTPKKSIVFRTPKPAKAKLSERSLKKVTPNRRIINLRIKKSFVPSPIGSKDYAVDKAIQRLQLGKFAAVVKECASGVDTLPFITIADLTSRELKATPLTHQQATFVIKKIQKYSSVLDENKDPNSVSQWEDKALLRDLDNLEIIERQAEANDILNCLASI
jgi:hypothetical protein